MKQRIITAIFYIGAMLGIIALKIFVPDYVNRVLLHLTIPLFFL